MNTQQLPTITLSDIAGQAKKIRDIAQSILDTCESGQPINHYARNKATGGSLAGDAASLGTMIVAYECQDRKG